MDDIDERLDRLEKLVRAHVLEPAEVPVGTAMSVAVAKVERAAKVVKALADEIPAPEPMPGSKAGLREEVTELRRQVKLYDDYMGRDLAKNHFLEKELKDANKRASNWEATYNSREHELLERLDRKERDLVSARADANFAKEELRKYKAEVEVKLRQLATSLSNS
jgi:hypothetical protein